LEYAPAQNPTAFQMIGNFSQQQQPNAGATLATWDTRTVQNGTYILRLAVFSNSGGYLYRQVQVNVNNPQPTPVPPTPTFIPTSVITTPIPFDTLPPPVNAQGAPGAPTPTLEVPLG